MPEKKTDPNALLSRDYEQFLEELSALLTDIPEEKRRSLIEGFVLGVLRS